MTEGLSDEKTRWAEDIEKLKSKASLVPAHSIIASAMVAYSGPFTSEYRIKLEKVNYFYNNKFIVILKN